MKKTGLILFSMIFSTVLAAQELRVMSYNIRLNVASDSLNAWPYRKEMLASQVLFHDIQLLGVQEALHGQMTDLQQLLPRYRYVGTGREDGKTGGEYSAIFYDTTRLQLIKTSTFWLSLTPHVPGSKSWDAAITRIVTWAEFKDRKSKKSFYAFNTHFDHMGKTARLESARFLLKAIDSIAGKKAVVLTGDFNATPAEPPIQLLLDQQQPTHLKDAKTLSVSGHYGPTGTFNGFATRERDDFPIDYIFLKGRWKVLKHATLSQTWKGRFASDHFAVMAVLKQR